MFLHLSSAALGRALIVTALSAALLVPGTVSFADGPSAPMGTIVGTVTCGADQITPAPAARIVVEGMNISTSPDAAGKFTLIVPANQVLNIDALADPTAAVTSTRYNVSIVAGGVTDIGNLDLAVCPQAQPAAPAVEPSQWAPENNQNFS